MNRRAFNKLSALGAGALIAPGPLLAFAEKPKMALQLWTVRELIEEDLEKTIDFVSHIGFSAVETAFWPEGISFERAAKVIAQYGMDVCSIHNDLPTKENQNQLLEMAEAYRNTKMIWHGWPEDVRYQSDAGIAELAEIYNEANAFFKSHELQFGLHNHWWEFQPHADGQLPFDILKEQIDEDIFFEIDTYWTKVAGQDPAEIVKKYGTRAPFLHIKDGPAVYNEALEEDNPDPMVAVGQGTLDFPAIAKAGKINTKWMIVELDNCATDMMDAVRESYVYLKKNKMAKGRI